MLVGFLIGPREGALLGAGVSCFMERDVGCVLNVSNTGKTELIARGTGVSFGTVSWLQTLVPMASPGPWTLPSCNHPPEATGLPPVNLGSEHLLHGSCTPPPFLRAPYSSSRLSSDPALGRSPRGPGVPQQGPKAVQALRGSQ